MSTSSEPSNPAQPPLGQCLWPLPGTSYTFTLPATPIAIWVKELKLFPARKERTKGEEMWQLENKIMALIRGYSCTVVTVQQHALQK